MKRAIIALAALSLLGLAGGRAYAVTGTCGVTAGTPHIELLDEQGNFLIQATAGLNSCTKDGVSRMITAQLVDAQQGVMASGSASKACGRLYRFSCGTSVILQTTLVCADSNDPAVLDLKLVVDGAGKHVESQTVHFDCSGYGGGDGGATALAVAGNPDYVSFLTGDSSTVIQGQTFTRTLTITNQGTGGSTWPVQGFIRGLAHMTYVGISDVQGFAGSCGQSKSRSGTMNYAVCNGAYLLPGQSASFTLIMRAPAGGWIGYGYLGNGEVRKTANEYEADTLNNFSQSDIWTEVIA